MHRIGRAGLLVAVMVLVSGCRLYGWGLNDVGQLGTGYSDSPTSPRLSGLGSSTWNSIDTSGDQSCGIQSNGSLWCWGFNDAGQLGDGTTTSRTGPTRVGTSTDWKRVVVESTHACGVRTTGELWCWGANSAGQLGDGTTTPRLAPVRIGTATDWANVAAGEVHTCGTRTTGELWCWGANTVGQVGDGTTTPRVAPVRIGAATDWAAVSAGRVLSGTGSTCGVRTTGELWCWGDNTFGQLGDGTTSERHAPTRVGTATDWKSVSASGHTCGVRTSSQLWCWGRNGAGQVGDGTTSEQHAPTRVGTGTNWSTVSVGGSHTCGVRTPGTAWCWGANSDGQLGDGTTTERHAPTQVGTAADWQAVATGGASSLGLRNDQPTDTDSDRLPDSVETNTGVFVSSNNTGTSPTNADTDGDGIQDGDEALGTLGGLALPSMGTSPVHKNVLLEMDWFDDSLDCGAHTHRPSDAAIASVTAAFANGPISNPDGTTGVALIVDYGQGGAFTGGNGILDANGVIDGGIINGFDAEFDLYKAFFFAGNRNGYFHYVLSPHRYNTNSGSSGQAELPGDDLIVSLQCSQSTSNVANTIMHELGHNLNLRHGGTVNENYKPNYNSVMNYRYQFPGVDNNCTVAGNGVLDYSRGTRITLNENSLDENNGICGPGFPIDWNSDTVLQTSVSVDTNCASNDTSGCGLGSSLTDSNDWTHLSFGGLAETDGAPVQQVVNEQPVPAPYR